VLLPSELLRKKTFFKLQDPDDEGTKIFRNIRKCVNKWEEIQEVLNPQQHNCEDLKSRRVTVHRAHKSA